MLVDQQDIAGCGAIRSQIGAPACSERPRTGPSFRIPVRLAPNDRRYGCSGSAAKIKYFHGPGGDPDGCRLGNH